MRVIFMGTPDFAAAALDALVASEHQVVAVVSQPDRPAGRGKHTVATPVAARAAALGLPLMQPESVKTRAFRDTLAAYEADVAVVVAFGHLLGPKALAVPRLGCLNIHASVLPRWRGASPIQSALLAGDPVSGVSVMQMDPGMDTGAVLAVAETPISDSDTAASLHDRLAALGAALIVQTLDQLALGPVTAQPQDDALATDAGKLTKAQGVLDWAQPAAVLSRQVRGLHPWPGTQTVLAGQPLKILPPVSVAAVAPSAPAGSPPGTVLGVVGGDSDAWLQVLAGDGHALWIGQLQLPGKKPLDVSAFVAGNPLAPGTVLG